MQFLKALPRIPGLTLTNKLLILGPLANKQDPSRTGGAIILFQEILKELNRQKADYKVIDTNKHNYGSKFITFIKVSAQIIRETPKHESAVFFTSTNYLFFLPVLRFVCSLSGTKLIMRKFGGELQHILDKRGIKAFYIKWLLKRPYKLLIETKGLQSYLAAIGVKSEWMPNARHFPIITSAKHHQGTTRTKMVYLNRLSSVKGVHQLIALDEYLTNGISIDVYGPEEDIKRIQFENLNKVFYKGVAAHETIYDLLSVYDAVVLPTSYEGEGYPGIIIEALGVGIPVVTTNHNYIAEIVQDGVNGILTNDNTPQNILDGLKAVNGLDKSNLEKSRAFMLENFSIEKNVKRLLSLSACV